MTFLTIVFVNTDENTNKKIKTIVKKMPQKYIAI